MKSVNENDIGSGISRMVIELDGLATVVVLWQGGRWISCPHGTSGPCYASAPGLLDCLLTTKQAIVLSRIETTLRELVERHKAADSGDRNQIELEMMNATECLDVCPDWFDYPCGCKTCRSYID